MAKMLNPDIQNLPDPSLTVYCARQNNCFSMRKLFNFGLSSDSSFFVVTFPTNTTFFAFRSRYAVLALALCFFRF
jgi:hypothetical protein